MGAFDPPFKLLPTFLAAVIALLAIAQRASADSPTLSGRWSASAMRSDWKIGDWGTACGPAPSGGGAPAGPVTVSQTGGELSFKGAGRDFTTAECWEQYPGLTRVSHSGGARSWRSVCKTQPGDPRQATIVTTLSATDNTITFDETGQYQFIIKGQNCTASARRTRTYALVLREGEAPPSLPIESPAKVVDEPRPAEQPKPAVCTSLGPPERLEVRPLRKLMKPGESFSFRAAVLDAKGCALPLATSWKLAGPAQGVRVPGPGKVEVDEGAPEAEVALQVTVGDRSAKVFVEVASRERYDALLAERGLNREGESSDAAITRIASESLGGRATVARDDSQTQKRLFVAVVGGAALLLGVVGFLMVRRSRAERRAAENAANAASQERPASTPRRPRQGTKVCPTCREAYAATSEFCAVDGNRLVLASSKDAPAPGGGVCPVCGHGYDPGISACPKHQEELVPVGVYMAARAQAAPISRKICPVCGAQFGGESEFCGQCGASLVPVN